MNPIKATSVRLIVKHNYKVNVYLLSATLNSPNEPAGGVSPHSSNIAAEKTAYTVPIRPVMGRQLKSHHEYRMKHKHSKKLIS